MTDEKDSREEAERLRQQEIAEERVYRGEVREDDPKFRIESVQVKRTARAVRGWILSNLVPDAVVRMYDIGMGIQTFDTPTQAGNVVQIEAPPSVQQKALHALIAFGLPAQVGLADDDGNILPGVFALGTLDLDAARASAHGERYVAPEAHARLVAAVQNGGEVPTGPAVQAPLRPMAERIANGEFQVVEVIEGVGSSTSTSEDQAPGPIVAVDTPEKAALRAHRARLAKNSNGRRA